MKIAVYNEKILFDVIWVSFAAPPNLDWMLEVWGLLESGSVTKDATLGKYPFAWFKKFVEID